ncbi:hypothetical protein SIIN_2987_T [Serendipita indica DSM 11827]|nr:hypothetical protein SIIN_2987_T [Serendipita indica DSM 11827]
MATLAHRNISRVTSTVSPEIFRGIVAHASTLKLTYLSFHDVHVELMCSMRLFPDTFRNLRHLGRIVLRQAGKHEIISALADFSMLRRLESLDITGLFDSRFPDPWTSSLLQEMIFLHKNLRKVHIDGTYRHIWILRDGWVREQPSRVYTCWDMINGDWDDI